MGSKLKDDDFLDMRKFVDDISINMDDYIKINFLTPYQLKIKSDAIFEELPLFKNTSGPRSYNWGKRVSEELEIFEILKQKYRYSVGYLVFDDLKKKLGNDRVWETNFYFSKDSKPLKLEIRLSLMYPRQIPLVSRSTGDYHVTLTDKCFGLLERRWRSDGKYGLPHFCTMIGYYYALEKMSRIID